MQRIAHSLITLAKGNFGLVTVPTSSLRCGLAFLCSLTRDQVDSDGSFGRPTFVMKIPLSPLLLRRHELYVWLLLILVAALVRVYQDPGQHQDESRIFLLPVSVLPLH